MRRREFLGTAAAAVSRASPLQGASKRIAFGGIGIECSTYSRIRAKEEDFTILRDQPLSDSARFAFLKKYPHPFLPTVVATAVPGGPVDSAFYARIKAEFLQAGEGLATARWSLPRDAWSDVRGGHAGCRGRLVCGGPLARRQRLPNQRELRSARQH